MYQHTVLSPWQIVQYFARMGILGPLLGLLVGFISLRWMSATSQKFSLDDVTMQFTITLCAVFVLKCSCHNG
jgi:NhaP-type Na+/H+ or K+/H+ antiporter